MSALADWLGALPALLLLAALAWGVCTVRRNAGLVDIFWSLFILLAALWYWRDATPAGPRALPVLLVTGAWALRLAAYLALRNWSAPEDHRYQAIRARNEPGFWWKSAYLVFGLQALLALAVAAPLSAAMRAGAPLNALDMLGLLLAAGGLLFEAVADAQLARFRADPASRGQVLDHGLWRYTRHPNYFGEFCVWWGFGLVGIASGGWWTIISPLLMSVLLLRVSGVTLLEQDIGTRRPAYAAYVARTNAFFPGPRKSS